MQAKLTQIQTSHSNSSVRTDIVEGTILELPTVGMPLVFFSQPLTPNTDIRIIKTSPVTRVVNIENKNIEYVVGTENSVYKLEILDNPQEN